MGGHKTPEAGGDHLGLLLRRRFGEDCDGGLGGPAHTNDFVDAALEVVAGQRAHLGGFCLRVVVEGGGVQSFLQTTRIQGGTAAAGQADATTILAQVAGGIVNDPQISATRTVDTATV
ncbi:MAG TPA: hypothetical protein VF755_22145, partial [Catenuloplanes sp.]